MYGRLWWFASFGSSNWISKKDNDNMDNKSFQQIKRKISKDLKQNTFNPDHYTELFNIEVPHNEIDPQLSDYGLTKEHILEIARSDIKFKSDREKRVKYSWIVTPLLTIVISSVYLLFETTISLSDIILTIITGGLLGAFFNFYIFQFISESKPKETDLRRKYKEYLTAKDTYAYWQRKKQKEYWNSLTGHEFEEALAQMFRKNGYLATVCAPGGDGGIDIILNKENDITLVQCKAHKNPVGPSVARDFYGTLIHNNATKGLVASLSGFTSGFYEFIKDKPISIITLDDIIKM